MIGGGEDGYRVSPVDVPASSGYYAADSASDSTVLGIWA
jgi:hypothetical protein